MNMKNFTLSTIVAGSLFLSGCADTWNKADNRGGLFASKSADYIIINHSGGEIMDVYKLRNVFVSSPENSDGWIFKDQAGNSINLGGDVKHIRLNGNNQEELWDKYCEYHQEFANGLSYIEYCSADKGN